MISFPKFQVNSGITRIVGHHCSTWSLTDWSGLDWKRPKNLLWGIFHFPFHTNSIFFCIIKWTYCFNLSCFITEDKVPVYIKHDIASKYKFKLRWACIKLKYALGDQAWNFNVGVRGHSDKIWQSRLGVFNKVSRELTLFFKLWLKCFWK